MLCQTPFGRESLPHSLEESICSGSGRNPASRDLLFHHVLPSCIGHFCFATFCQPEGVSVFTVLHRVRLASSGTTAPKWLGSTCPFPRHNPSPRKLSSSCTSRSFGPQTHCSNCISAWIHSVSLLSALSGKLLRSSRPTLVSQRDLNMFTPTRRLDKRNDPCSGALGLGCRLRK